jgi:glycosyltransferase involved in cell wall biosynthesis
VRVLHVIDALGVGGGAEHALAATLPLLRDRGIDSRVVTLTPREGGLQAALRKQGFDVEVLHGPLPRQIHALRRRIRRERPDVVHATLFTSCLATRLACVGIPVGHLDSLVSTSYDPIRVAHLGVPAWKLRLVRTIDAATARSLGGHFHVLTEAVRDEAVDALGIARERTTVVPRGRDAAALGELTPGRRSTTRRELGLGDDTPVVLTVGRQDRAKDHAGLVRAFAAVRREVPEATLLVAGRPGDASTDLSSALGSSGLPKDAVQLLGHRTDVADLLVAADVFAFPSMYEGLGSAMIEAMALSTPVVGSDAPAIREVLGEGAYGVIVPRGDTVTLTQALLTLLGDPELRRTYAARGHQRFLERYRLGTVVDQMVELYRSLAADVSVPRTRRGTSAGSTARTAGWRHRGDRARRDARRPGR